MTIKEFNTKIINQGFTQTDKHIVFQTPDGKVYTNIEIISIRQGDKVICKVKLNDKIKPKFKVGDVVTNISGLYPNVRCTITTVDKEKQLYYFRETAGTTSFKDQDKLMLVKDEGVRPPVEDEDKLDILSECYALNAKINVLKYDIEHYPLIYNVLKQIIAISKEGAISYNLVVPMKKEVDEDYEAGFYYVEDEICGIIRWHFDKLGYKIDEKVKDNYNEFFITW